MEDKATFAKDVLCALLVSQHTIMVNDKECETAEEWAHAAMDHTNALLAELARTQPTPPPAAPNGLPVWRKMTAIPKHGNCVVVKRIGDPHWQVTCLYLEGRGWVEIVIDRPYAYGPDDRWLDLNGFTPEVGE